MWGNSEESLQVWWSWEYYISISHIYKISKVVMLQLEAWEQIDGDTIIGLLQNVTQHFPHPVRVELDQGAVVITDYEVWKRKIRRRQGDKERQ